MGGMGPMGTHGPMGPIGPRRRPHPAAPRPLPPAPRYHTRCINPMWPAVIIMSKTD